LCAHILIANLPSPASLATLQVICAPEVQEALLLAMQGGASCTVFGSSLGWLVFYASIAMGWPSVGWVTRAVLLPLCVSVPQFQFVLNLSEQLFFVQVVVLDDASSLAQAEYKQVGRHKRSNHVPFAASQD